MPERAETLNMSQKERDRLKVLDRVTNGKLTRRLAAESLGVTERQLYRILRRYRQEGDRGIVHRLRGQSRSNRSHSHEIQQKSIRLYREQYSDYHPTLLSEVLLSEHGIDVSRQTVTRWLKAEGLLGPIRKERPHRRKRERREAIGELIQFDGSHHDWFEGRRAPCCLLVAIDDASGRIFLRFAESENVRDVLLTLEAYVRRFGIPRQFYSDYGAVYNVPPSADRRRRRTRGSHDDDETTTGVRRLTDVGRALKRLGIEHIFASSPQAKGRVERSNRTHQDRLVKALRRSNISTIEQANAFLEQTYIDQHNQRFAQLKDLPDVHRCSRGLDFRNIFCFETTRHVYHDYTIVLGGEFIQLEHSDHTPLPPPRQAVIVRRWISDNSLHVFWHDQEVRCSIFHQRRHKTKPNKYLISPPPADTHPWRRSTIGRGRYSGGKDIRKNILAEKKKSLSSIPSP